jgi:hypothetical protein
MTSEASWSLETDGEGVEEAMVLRFAIPVPAYISVGMHRWTSIRLSIRFKKSIPPYGFGKEAVLSTPGK